MSGIIMPTGAAASASGHASGAGAIPGSRSAGHPDADIILTDDDHDRELDSESSTSQPASTIREKREHTTGATPPAKRHEGKGSNSKTTNVMYEAMSQDEIMHKMLAQMTILGQNKENMATKTDIEGMEGRLMNKLKDETTSMKQEQDKFQGNIEARIKKLEESHDSDIKRIEQRVEEAKQATGKGSNSSMNNERN